MYKTILMILLTLLSLQAQTTPPKSAIVYYGEKISYPTVGIHDYIIVQPSLINPTTPGFQRYKEKIYAYVSIGEIDRDIKEYIHIKKDWIATKNKLWNSDVLDIRDLEYQNFLFERMIDPLIQRGFKNFFFDTLDSFHLYTKTSLEKRSAQKALAGFINEFHKRYPKAKLIINRGFEIIDDVHDAITAVLFESYYYGIEGDATPYKEVTPQDREWLDLQLTKVKKYNKDIICVDYLPPDELFSQKAQKAIQAIQKKGYIPYIADKDLLLYGNSSKVAKKREIFTLIDESKLDRSTQEAHLYGAVVLEYFGYKEDIYDINKPLPPIESMQHYKGVLIWLQASSFKETTRLFNWIKKLLQHDIKVVFMGNFVSDKLLSFLGINVYETNTKKVAIAYKNPMVGYEIDPPMTSNTTLYSVSKNAKPILTYRYADGQTSTPAAIMPWGGYVVGEAYINTIDDQNLWVIDPFMFFQEAFELEPIPVADVTTKTGKRLMFSHVDGDGLGNRVEGSYGKYSGDAILNHILKRYKVPHSISIIGAEVDPNGLFPKDYKELRAIVKEIYKLPNVEGATHTYTHPFFWGKIDQNGNLDPQYRLKVKGYKFSFEKEFVFTINEINNDFYPPNKTPKANTIFWSGDCIPRVNALSFIAKHHFQAINGGDTTISNEFPWLSGIAPLGLERDGYTQIYTGAQNENVFTNDWLGPFWGFKRVTQTFKLTNSPRRFKPIDIYYHLYSGSKRASLKALQYVFDWAIKQDVHPIFTSEYIPRVEEYYNYSFAQLAPQTYFFSGLDTLDTIRIEQKGVGVDLEASPTVIGIKHFENHTYLTLLPSSSHIIKVDPTQQYKNYPYLIDANGNVTGYKKETTNKYYKLSSYVPLQMSFHVPKECSIAIQPKPAHQKHNGTTYSYKYKEAKEAEVWIECSN